MCVCVRFGLSPACCLLSAHHMPAVSAAFLPLSLRFTSSKLILILDSCFFVSRISVHLKMLSCIINYPGKEVSVTQSLTNGFSLRQ